MDGIVVHTESRGGDVGSQNLKGQESRYELDEKRKVIYFIEL